MLAAHQVLSPAVQEAPSKMFLNLIGGEWSRFTFMGAFRLQFLVLYSIRMGVWKNFVTTPFWGGKLLFKLLPKTSYGPDFIFL